ncbi:sulfate/molybdate ABC transporter ATP-binding protein [Clostridium sp. Cult3]|uniref:sulfate/molybdate ABC transporter ATP-binding protein n=1 Tax=Clostridium sp. Cult3 TaxID=2079004 RepID=UPI003013E60B
MEFETCDETLAFLGASGCGKSMTLKCIAGIEKPDEGQIVLNNRVLFDSQEKINLLPQERKVGLLFQNYALFPNMTLEENIAIGVPKNCKNKQKVIEEKINTFSLKGLENNYPHQLSGGQQQRVALARMLVNEPEILMLDEPFSALDEHLRWKMEQELIDILRENQGSAIYVSHNKDEVYRICDRIAILHDGKIEEIKDKESLFNNPKTYNSAILTGCENISKVEQISENKVYAIDWGVELICKEIIDEDIKYVGIHKHEINLYPKIGLENSFELKLIDVIRNRSSYTLVLSSIARDSRDASSHIYAELSQDEFNKHSFDSMGLVYVNINPESLLLLR